VEEGNKNLHRSVEAPISDISQSVLAALHRLFQGRKFPPQNFGELGQEEIQINLIFFSQSSIGESQCVPL